MQIENTAPIAAEADQTARLTTQVGDEVVSQDIEVAAPLAQAETTGYLQVTGTRDNQTAVGGDLSKMATYLDGKTDVKLADVNNELFFNLVIATSAKQAKELTDRYGLSHVINVDAIAGERQGHARGEAIKQYLNKQAGVVTLVVLEQEVWVNALRDNTPNYAAPSWRRICDRVIGPKAVAQSHNLIVVAASSSNKTPATVTQGSTLPHHWVTSGLPRGAETKETQPKKAKPSNQKSERPVPKSAKGEQRSTNNSNKSNNNGNRQVSRPVTVSGRLLSDLLLVAKSQYGVLNGNAAQMEAVGEVLRYHNGRRHQAGAEADMLFAALNEFGNRQDWHRFSFIRGVVSAGGRGPEDLVGFLCAELAVLKIEELPPVDSKLAKQIEAVLSE